MVIFRTSCNLVQGRERNSNPESQYKVFPSISLFLLKPNLVVTYQNYRLLIFFALKTPKRLNYPAGRGGVVIFGSKNYRRMHSKYLFTEGRCQNGSLINFRHRGHSKVDFRNELFRPNVSRRRPVYTTAEV